MVAKILTGIQVTATDYQKYAKGIWITCLCLGILVAIFGKTPSQGALLITCSILGLPAYLIDQGNKNNKKKGRK